MTFLPALIIFDLDMTLWNFTFDNDVLSPFSRTPDGTVRDYSGKTIHYFAEVTPILAFVHEHNIKLAVISRSHHNAGVQQLLEVLDWKKYLSYEVIHAGTSTTLLKELQFVSKVPYSDMLYFDDSFNNIRKARTSDIVAVWVPNGITPYEMRKGLNQFLWFKGGTVPPSMKASLMYSNQSTVRGEETVTEKMTKSSVQIVDKKINAEN